MAAAQASDEIDRPRARAMRQRIDGPRSAIAAARWLRDEPGAIALSGHWFGGGTILLSHPSIASDPDDDPFLRLAASPVAYREAGIGERAIGGGWFGWLGFGLADQIESLAVDRRSTEQLASSSLAFYDHLVRCDEFGSWWFEALWTDTRADVLTERLKTWRSRLIEPLPPGRSYAASPLTIAAPGLAGHRAAVAETVRRIYAGEMSQTNICLELESRLDGDPLDLWVALASETRAARAAYVGPSQAGGHAVISASPELFLTRRGRRVETRPIKGTAPRTISPERLAGSEKDRAENVMIVDLMRNDLGRVCAYGTIAVTELCEVRPAAGVWHLESTVTGRLRPEIDDSALVHAAFPPGSVTGAPKAQALRVIRAVEPTARQAYCGAIGGVSPLAGLELSVAIRTLESAHGRLWLGAGGGITAESDPDGETEEAILKAASVAAACGIALAPQLTDVEMRRPDPCRGIIETLLVIDGTPVDLEAHLARLTASARALDRHVPGDLRARIVTAADASAGKAALRITVDDDGTRIDLRRAPPAHPITLVPLVVPGGLGVHKSADRGLLESYSVGDRAALILDSDGTVLEAGHAAVLLVSDGEIVAPPLDGRILPSLSRERVLAIARGSAIAVRITSFTLADLRASDAVVLTSSLRGPHLGLLPGGPTPGGLTFARIFELSARPGDPASAAPDQSQEASPRNASAHRGAGPAALG